MAILELINIKQQFKDGYSLKAVNLTVDQGCVRTYRANRRWQNDADQDY